MIYSNGVDGVPVPLRYFGVFTIWLTLSLAVMDGAIANVALPSIARDLHASPATSIWVINAYQLVLMICLLPLASLGEIIGYRRVYMGGLITFTAASFACAVSPSLLALASARVVQGLGAAGIMSVNVALTRFVYPQAMLGRGMGLNAMIAATAAAAGPSVAAGILSFASWPFLFAINVPLGVVAVLAALRALPETPHATHRFDTPSALLNGVMMATLIFALESLAHGGHSGLAAVETAVSAGSCVVLVRRQQMRTAPLLPVDLLRIPLFRLSAITSVCSFMAQMLAFTALPFYIEETLGRSATKTGLLMTPWPLAMILAAPIAGRLADRVSAGVLGSTGLAIFAGGLACLATMPNEVHASGIVWRMALCGIGFGFFQSPNNRAMVASAPPHRSGGASGALGTSRLLGQTVGSTLVALIFNTWPWKGAVVSLGLAALMASAGAAVSLSRLSLKPATRP